jgi:hypothetical protein
LLNKRDFIDAIGMAIAQNIPYAAGKIGVSEQRWLYYPVFLERRPSITEARAYEVALAYHCQRQSGVFPSDPKFVLAFTQFYAQHLQNLDTVGLGGSPMEAAILSHHSVYANFLRYQDLEPDRSVPVDETRCYLKHFKGKRLLLLAPFGRLLAERATRETFEGVWRKIGKPWFHPASVCAIEFPYGYDPRTWERFPTVIDLFASIMQQVEEVKFDIALIAAGGLGIPLASQIKRRGGRAISLGGHLQVLFGVMGRRWRDRVKWKRDYFNDSWIPMPAHYRPPDAAMLSDAGAYW